MSTIGAAEILIGLLMLGVVLFIPAVLIAILIVLIQNDEEDVGCISPAALQLRRPCPREYPLV